MNAPAPVLTIETPNPAESPAKVIFGRFMLPDMSEHPCQVAQISVEGGIFLSAKVPPANVQLVAYLDNIGRVEGQIVEPVPGGFAVRFILTGSRREKLAAKLDWQENAENGEEQRRHVRHEPKDSKSHITLPDGRVYVCEVIDISLSGAAVKTEVMPSLGTHVMLGKMRGRVVRFIEDGVAIEFSRQLDSAALTEKTR